MLRKIPVARPILGFGAVVRLINAAIHNEISGYSKQYIQLFEENLAKYVGTKHAIVVNSGTSAIHLALIGIGIKPGDKVAISSYTNMASFFPALQLGAIPVPIDVENVTWNMSSSDLESIISKEIKAIIVVHIFGHPANMTRIMELARKYEIPVIEDCAEALGASHAQIKVGGIGIVGCHSFYANKLITTGEGGALTTNDDDIAQRVRNFRSLSFGEDRKFIHSADGYNFRMTNLQAAIGVGQMKRIDKNIKLKRKIAKFYNSILEQDPRIQVPTELDQNFSVIWMYHIRIKALNFELRDSLIKAMAEDGIEIREGFVSYTMQTKVLNMWQQKSVRGNPLSEEISEQCIYLPSGPKLTKSKMRYICASLKSALDSILK